MSQYKQMAIVYQEQSTLTMLMGMVLILTSFFLMAMDGRNAAVEQQSAQ